MTLAFGDGTDKWFPNSGMRTYAPMVMVVMLISMVIIF